MRDYEAPEVTEIGRVEDLTQNINVGSQSETGT